LQPPKQGMDILAHCHSLKSITLPCVSVDMTSMHTGCPVIKGIKWGAPVWIHIDEFEPEAFRAAQAEAARLSPEARMRKSVPQEPGLCTDVYGERCMQWARTGECERNPGEQERGVIRKIYQCVTRSIQNPRDVIHNNDNIMAYITNVVTLPSSLRLYDWRHGSLSKGLRSVQGLLPG